MLISSKLDDCNITSFMNTPRGAALHIEEASMIPIVSSVLEFEKKKFWIALFSMMARREGTKANATSQPFGPFVASCGDWPNSKPPALLSEMVQPFFGVANHQMQSGFRGVMMEANEDPRHKIPRHRAHGRPR